MAKYHHQFASGESDEKDSEYLELYDASENEIKEEIISLKEKYNWSEHYRGIKYEVIEYPPKDFCLKEIDECNRSIKVLKAKIDRLNGYVKKYNQ